MEKNNNLEAEYASKMYYTHTEWGFFIVNCLQQAYLKILFHSVFLAQDPQQHLWLSVASNNTIYDGEKTPFTKKEKKKKEITS